MPEPDASSYAQLLALIEVLRAENARLAEQNAGQLREAIILDFPDLFDPKAVEVARKRLGR